MGKCSLESRRVGRRSCSVRSPGPTSVWLSRGTSGGHVRGCSQKAGLAVTTMAGTCWQWATRNWIRLYACFCGLGLDYLLRLGLAMLFVKHSTVFPFQRSCRLYSGMCKQARVPAPGSWLCWCQSFCLLSFRPFRPKRHIFPPDFSHPDLLHFVYCFWSVVIILMDFF